MRTVTRAAAIAILLAFASTASARQLPRLKVSENKRFLVTAAGQPFFWLGDTAWELFHRLTREDAERYLRNRAERRFTIVQAVVLAELDGLNDPNPYGHTPLRNNDPTQPNEDYFAHVDWIVKRANAMGLYIGMLPTWGDKWNRQWGVGPGDLHAGERACVRRMARASVTGTRASSGSSAAIVQSKATRTGKIIAGDGAKACAPAMAARISSPSIRRAALGPRPGSTTSHGSTSTCARTAMSPSSPAGTTRPARTTTAPPVKPVLDGEPIYEDHPVSFDAKKLGHSVSATCAGRSTGTCLPARSAIPMATTPSGRCGRPRESRSTTR